MKFKEKMKRIKLFIEDLIIAYQAGLKWKDIWFFVWLMQRYYD